jgi:hypothetical protein
MSRSGRNNHARPAFFRTLVVLFIVVGVIGGTVAGIVRSLPARQSVLTPAAGISAASAAGVNPAPAASAVPSAGATPEPAATTKSAAGVKPAAAAGISAGSAAGANSMRAASAAPAAGAKPVSRPALPRLHNRDVDSINTLFLGTSRGRLVMASIYTVDPVTRRSATVFYPPNLIIGERPAQTLEEVLLKNGPDRVRVLMAKKLEANLPHHVVFDREGMEQLARLIGPVRVQGKSIALGDLYVQPDTPEDEKILQEVARQFKSAGFIWKIPGLIRVLLGYTD